MSVLSVRLSKKEEEILNSLTTLLNKDRSTVIKYSLTELYEDHIDLLEAEKFEKKLDDGKVKFIPSDEVLKDLI